MGRTGLQVPARRVSQCCHYACETCGTTGPLPPRGHWRSALTCAFSDRPRRVYTEPYALCLMLFSWSSIVVHPIRQMRKPRPRGFKFLPWAAEMQSEDWTRVHPARRHALVGSVPFRRDFSFGPAASPKRLGRVRTGARWASCWMAGAGLKVDLLPLRSAFQWEETGM